MNAKEDEFFEEIEYYRQKALKNKIQLSLVDIFTRYYYEFTRNRKNIVAILIKSDKSRRKRI